jgi:hypothetical protein
MVTLSLMVAVLAWTARLKPASRSFSVARVPMLIASMTLFVLISALLFAAFVATLPRRIDDLAHGSRRAFGLIGLVDDTLALTLALLVLVPVVSRLKRLKRDRHW